MEENTILKATEVQFPNKPTVSSEAKVGLIHMLFVLIFNLICDHVVSTFHVFMQQLIRLCLAYRKEDRCDVLQLAKNEYLQPPVPRHARQNAAAIAAAAASSSHASSSSCSTPAQPSTPTGMRIERQLFYHIGLSASFGDRRTNSRFGYLFCLQVTTQGSRRLCFLE